MITIPVNIPNARYEILVAPSLLESLGERIKHVVPCDRAALITDSNVAEHYLPRVEQILADAGIEANTITVAAGEETKTLSILEPIYDRLLEGRSVERDTPLIALGGGMITDLGGFIAATLLRGLPFIPVPTSLLAMVDAGIGGKTGINHSRGKNLIGSFYQPRAVFIDPGVLATLPLDELRNGLAECIKHALISDSEMFIRMESRIDRALAGETTYLTELVGQNAAIKARVVQSDPFERGDRAMLNFGHTFAHAIEWASKFTIPHGQAVAIGICAASYASVKMGLLTEVMFQRIVKLISRAGLPTRTDRIPADLVFEAMRRDKKITGGKARFVLLDRIGHAIVRDDVPESLVHQVIDHFRS